MEQSQAFRPKLVCVFALAFWTLSPALSAQQTDQSKPAVAATTAAAQAPVVDDRQKAMQANADQLVALAEALKASVDRASKDEISLDVIRRAEQIERLAKEMRDQTRQ